MNRRKFLTLTIATILTPATIIKKTDKPWNDSKSDPIANIETFVESGHNDAFYDQSLGEPYTWERGERHEYIDYSAFEEAILNNIATAYDIPLHTLINS